MQILYTIGYEGTDIERFVATLKAVGIQRLADVRAVLHSRKRGFSKKSLAAHLEAEGIEYLTFQPLGDPKPGRDAARAGQQDVFRAIYTTHLNSEGAQSSLKELTAVAEQQPTCLLCFERDPVNCHRSIIAEELKSCGFEVLNLFGDAPERYVRNAHRLPSYSPRQGTATA
ncbi:DUF488 domain-containing protein [Oceanibaculum nanhaiense]|uniref:DUF488 domain-containing protein n=1 Tax=Oceanibaculum nanhaiense TaxID=1909734 RepID=UPI000A3BCC5D|nr:DUF488 domain-containing protein [Oceanibaculum nanhaiense]